MAVSERRWTITTNRIVGEGRDRRIILGTVRGPDVEGEIEVVEARPSADAGAVLSAESAFDPGLLRRVAGDCEAGGLGGAARLLRDIAWHVEQPATDRGAV
jgi:hypothetical protein